MTDVPRATARTRAQARGSGRLRAAAAHRIAARSAHVHVHLPRHARPPARAARDHAAAANRARARRVAAEAAERTRPARARVRRRPHAARDAHVAARGAPPRPRAGIGRGLADAPAGHPGPEGQVPLAEVVYDRVAIMDGRRIADRFEEVEIEAIDGDELALNRLEAVLVAAGAEPGNGLPKAFRVLGVPEPSRPLPAPDQEVVRAALEQNAVELARHDPGTRLGHDPEDLHRFRVATRRLRAVLRVARPLLDREWADGLRTELGWLGSSLGPVRDLDVLVEHLTAELAELDDDDRAAGAPLLERLAAERVAAARGVARGALDPALLRPARRARGCGGGAEVQRRRGLGHGARRAGVRPAREGREGASARHLRRRPPRHPRPRQARALLHRARRAARRRRARRR